MANDSMPDQPVPRVGVAAIVVRGDGSVLMLRKKKPGHRSHNKWEFPGGKLEFQEGIGPSALRELQEETGVIASNPKIIGVTEESYGEEYHWVTVYVFCDHLAGIGEVMEPDKAFEVAWFPYGMLPQDSRSEVQQFLKNFGDLYLNAIIRTIEIHTGV